jgi:replicative DNA helicase
MLVYDEFDWIEDTSAIKSTMVIATQNPNIRTVIASTASGKKDLYYKFCTDPSHGYEEHRWSVWEGNMVWDIETAIQESMKMNWNEYVQEYEADFGEESMGWIPKELIEEIFGWPQFDNGVEGSDFYDNMGKMDITSPIRTMGVDWDKMGTVGPSIVITELDRRVQKMRVVHAEVIDKSVKGFTLGNAVRRIIKLNEMYDPNFIYCDRGYGERQVEELHEYGQMHPDTGLSYKVKGIHFSEKVQVHDYVSNQVVKKPVKQVMAADMRQWFYERRVIISRYRADLRRQLENFRVEKVTQQGYKFNEDDEHLVDAFMLSIHAVSVHFDELFERMAPPVIMSTGIQLSDMYKTPIEAEHRKMNDRLMDKTVAPAVYHVGYKPVREGRFSRHYDGPGVNMPSRPNSRDWGKGRGGSGWGR